MVDEETLMQEFAARVQDGERYMKASSIIESFKKSGIWDDKLPMLSVPFLDWFNSYNFKYYTLVEFGSGKSTNYFADRTNHVYSFETDKAYYTKVSISARKNVSMTLKSADDLENGNFDLNMSDKTIVFIDSDCNRFMLTKSVLSKALPAVIIFDNSEWFINSSKEIISKGYNEFIFWGVRPESFIDKATSVFIKKDGITLERKYSHVPPNGTGLPIDPYPEDNIK